MFLLVVLYCLIQFIEWSNEYIIIAFIYPNWDYKIFSWLSRATIVYVVVVHSCLQLRLIMHEWGASFFEVGASLKNCSCRLKKTKSCGSFSPRADKLLADLEQILPHKKAFLEGSAHPRVLSALGPKDPHGFVTCGKGTPLHV